MISRTPFVALVPLLAAVSVAHSQDTAPSWSLTVGPGEVADMAVDDSGNAYIVGTTASDQFPAVRAADPDLNETGPFKVLATDAVVCKIGADGKVAWSTFLGGENKDIGHGIAIDAEGRVVVVGTTESMRFPGTVGGGHVGQHPDGFVAVLSAEGSLVGARYLGGDFHDEAFSVAATEDGGAIVAGETIGGFPAGGGRPFAGKGAYYPDAFVAKLDRGGEIVWSTCLGGELRDEAVGAVIGPDGSVYLTGTTKCRDFPNIPADAGPDSWQGHTWHDPYLVKLDADGKLLWTRVRYVNDRRPIPHAIAALPSGGACIVGEMSWRMKGMPPEAWNSAGRRGDDYFAWAWDADGDFLWEEFYGGDQSQERAYAVAVNPVSGMIHLGGSANMPDFPVLRGGAAGPGATHGTDDAFAAAISDAGETVFATIGGGTRRDVIRAVDVGPTGAIYIAGETGSDDYPASDGKPGIFVAAVGG